MAGVTLLGYRNPFRRVSGAVRGLLRRPPPSSVDRRAFVIGHRGARRVAPENTVESFEKAIVLGADAVEADVCVTRDGRFVLWHDSRPGEKGAIFRGVKAATDHYSRRAFARTTGTWPGEERPEPE